MIIAVACRIGQKIWTLPPPNRHHNVLWLMGEREVEGYHLCEQGFLTDSGDFLTRSAARSYAMATGQCPKPDHERHLFSEDLW